MQTGLSPGADEPVRTGQRDGGSPPSRVRDPEQRREPTALQTASTLTSELAVAWERARSASSEQPRVSRAVRERSHTTRM